MHVHSDYTGFALDQHVQPFFNDLNDERWMFRTDSTGPVVHFLFV